jgi:hypothetical protein
MLFNYSYKFKKYDKGLIYNRYGLKVYIVHNRLYTKLNQKVVQINQDLARLLIDRAELFN